MDFSLTCLEMSQGLRARGLRLVGDGVGDIVLPEEVGLGDEDGQVDVDNGSDRSADEAQDVALSIEENNQSLTERIE